MIVMEVFEAVVTQGGGAAKGYVGMELRMMLIGIEQFDEVLRPPEGELDAGDSGLMFTWHLVEQSVARHLQSHVLGEKSVHDAKCEVRRIFAERSKGNAGRLTEREKGAVVEAMSSNRQSMVELEAVPSGETSDDARAREDAREARYGIADEGEFARVLGGLKAEIERLARKASAGDALAQARNEALEEVHEVLRFLPLELVQAPTDSVLIQHICTAKSFV